MKKRHQYIVPVVNAIQVCPINSVLEGTGGSGTMGNGKDAAPARGGLYV